MKIDPKQLQLVIAKLLEVYHPIRIYLYGSQAWGEPAADSDIDLFIILATSEFELDERIRMGARALSGSGLDIDLMVLTRAEVAARQDHPSTLTHKVLSKGIMLYEAA